MRSGCSCGARACASKKTLFALEQARADVARRRHRWRSWQTRFDPKRLVFIDETWIKTNMAPLRGWGSKGERLRGFGHMALRRRSRLNHPTWRMHQLLHQRRIRFRQSMNRSSPHRGHGFSPQGGRLNGEINVTSKSWEEPKVLMPDQILEIRIVSDRNPDCPEGQAPRRWRPSAGARADRRRGRDHRVSGRVPVQSGPVLQSNR